MSRTQERRPMVSSPTKGASRLECDLVMKGGITSGVIYPRLVSRLSEKYTLRSIGGTSAGAIAAAAAAAAQLGVSTGANPAAFAKLDLLPSELGGPASGQEGSRLFNFFQPQAALRRHFALLSAALNARGAVRKVLAIAGTLVIRFPFGAAIGALPGALVVWQSSGVARAIGWALLLLGITIGALLAALRSFGRGLPRNRFGLCNGMSGRDPADKNALVPWLDDYLNSLAGKNSGEPLTFGELWAGRIRKPGAPAPAIEDGQRQVDLTMMTTALNLGRPFRVPFPDDEKFYFDADEMAALMPARVLKWMADHARPSQTATILSHNGRRFYALPTPEDFPVLLGVRLSLSFPILLSTMPLYVVDRTRKANDHGSLEATRVYFSDGGICSNFPLHFFDSLLPSRPTFAVNLKPFHPDYTKERVWLPRHNSAGIEGYCPPLSDAPGLASVGGFVWTIISTMQNWRDQLQTPLPGYRDRIVHVSQSPEEGGLNLNMRAAVIELLGQSGKDAAHELLKVFAPNGQGDPNGWDNHQRIRARTLVSLLQRQLQALGQAIDSQQAPSWADILGNPNPPSYPFENDHDRVEAEMFLKTLKAISDDLTERGVNLSDGGPHPSPDLHIAPRV